MPWGIARRWPGISVRAHAMGHGAANHVLAMSRRKILVCDRLRCTPPYHGDGTANNGAAAPAHCVWQVAARL